MSNSAHFVRLPHLKKKRNGFAGSISATRGLWNPLGTARWNVNDWNEPHLLPGDFHLFQVDDLPMIVFGFLCAATWWWWWGYQVVHFSLHVDANWIAVPLLILELWC